MEPETVKNKNPLLNKLSTLLFYISLFVFIVALAFPHNPAGNWYQQFMPDIGGRTITDITFIDSLTGYCITSRLNDTSFVLKTTNSGDSWSYNYTATGFIFSRIQFLNQNTGFAGGTDLIKTINGGINWIPVNTSLFFEDMTFINSDTGWFAKTNSANGGIFRTTNGGVNWENQLSLGSQNPSKIYMYNARIGFASSTAGLYKTTNGSNWLLIPGGAFTDIHFVDSLAGWKNNGVATLFQKTTDGGQSWVTYNLPPEEGIIVLSRLKKFDNVLRDTIFGVGADAFFGAGQFRGLIYKSTNSGQNWGYELPDTAIHSGQYQHIQFTDKMKGWAYWFGGGVHTTNGGGPTIFLPVVQLSSEVPMEFKLFNNYPNPFNPVTNIKYTITSNVKRQTSNVKLIVYDVLGKETAVLIDEEQTAGTYRVDFNGSSYSSGVYFYSLIIDGKIIDTRKMLLIK